MIGDGGDGNFYKGADDFLVFRHETNFVHGPSYVILVAPVCNCALFYKPDLDL